MELRDLSYFLKIIGSGSLSKAAEELHVAQPTLSHAITRIERELGQEVLLRSSNKRAGLRLSAAGEALRERAKRALAEIDGLHEDLNALAGLHAGQVRLAGIQSLNLTFLPGVLAHFALEYPNIEIELHTHASDSIPDRVRAGHEDLGILAMSQQQHLHGLNLHELYEEDFVAIVRNDDPLAKSSVISLANLKQRELLLVNPSSYTGTAILAACAEAGFQPKARLVLESGEALRECVRAGLGMCILPRGYLADHEHDLQAISLKDPQPTRHVFAISGQTHALSHASKSFLTMLQSCARLR